jgi:hypothetical protein
LIWPATMTKLRFATTCRGRGTITFDIRDSLMP